MHPYDRAQFSLGFAYKNLTYHLVFEEASSRLEESMLIENRYYKIIDLLFKIEYTKTEWFQAFARANLSFEDLKKRLREIGATDVSCFHKVHNIGVRSLIPFAGKGSIIYPNGDVYIGDLIGSERRGQGTLTTRTGYVYTGGWENDKKSGIGTQTGTNNTFYTGSWRAGQPHGTGSIIYINGSNYTGEFEKGKRHGLGTLTTIKENKEIVQKGTWKNSLLHGKGIQFFSNGDIYDGDWQYGKAHGTGSYLYADGFSSYKGEFQNNLQHGKGTLIVADSNILDGFSIYVGHFAFGKKHGVGIAKHKDGAVVRGFWHYDILLSLSSICKFKRTRPCLLTDDFSFS